MGIRVYLEDSKNSKVRDSNNIKKRSRRIRRRNKKEINKIDSYNNNNLYSSSKIEKI